jgi:hypothetical protein
MSYKNHDQDNNYNHNHHGTTYFRGMEKVWLDLSASPFALRNIQDRVLFLENLVAPSMLMPYSYPWSAHLLYEQEEEKDTIARESSLLYVPNTRLSRVVRDLMKHLDLAQGDFVCLHLRLLEDFDSFCRDVEKQRQLFVPADFFWQAWRQGYSCAPSVSQILSCVSYHLFERHRKIFITTDDGLQAKKMLGHVPLFKRKDHVGSSDDDAYTNTEKMVTTSLDTAEYLSRRFPRASQTFIDGLHTFVDQYLCSLAEKAVLNRFSMFSHQISILIIGHDDSSSFSSYSDHTSSIEYWMMDD